jgi:flagellar basal body-associated protein FliL
MRTSTELDGTYAGRRPALSILVIILIVIVVLAVLGFFGRGRF